jgi:alkylation response protein AidB-like acyl-CoA dehydrogenase
MNAARRLKRNGRPILDDAVTRQKLGRIWADLEVERYGALRVLTMLERGEHPGAGGSLTKLSYSEFEKRFMELAEEILGPYGQLTDGVPAEYRLEVDTAVGDHGTWAYAFLWSRAGTIYAGSSEIQKNVIGERILGLPKESRADRVGGTR